MNIKSSFTAGAPYIYAKTDSSALMRDVIIALLPTLAAGIYLYGWDVLLNALICAGCCVALEAVFQKAMNRPVSVQDLSAVVTGLIVYVNLPVSAPVWIGIIACFIAIVIVKQLFGGIGKNLFNPALVGILAVRLGFSSYMTQWTVNGKMTRAIVDGAAGKGYGSTVLQLYRVNGELPSALQLLTEYKNGPVSQAWAIATLAGLVYLLLKKVIRPWASLAFFGTVAFVSILSTNDPVLQLLGGGTLFFGVFMVNDYTTSPITDWGKLVYGLVFGMISMFFRTLSSFEDGVGFALLFSNMLLPYIDAFTRPRPFGHERRGGKHD